MASQGGLGPKKGCPPQWQPFSFSSISAACCCVAPEAGHSMRLLLSFIRVSQPSPRSRHPESACAFELLMFNGDDLRRRPYVDRKAALRKLLRHGRGIQYVEHAESHGDKFSLLHTSSGWRGS